MSVPTPPLSSTISVALLTGGFDRPYAFGLITALGARGITLDVIGSNELDGSDVRAVPRLRFINLHGDQRNTAAGVARRIARHFNLYLNIIGYAACAKVNVFHILWNNKLKIFDRTLLMLYYKVLGKKVVLTAHNVNAARRDGEDSYINRWSLKIQYRLSDHIFVHTDQMKHELLNEFGVRDGLVSTIPFGINNAVPNTELTPLEAKLKLGISSSHKTVLFFGNIRPYKGLEYLVTAFQSIAREDKNYRLIIAGEPKKDSIQYWEGIKEAIVKGESKNQIILETRYISDEETELYFKAADILVLPYTTVFQSGVLFLAYSFGLPVIASDVGSLRDEIAEGETGYLCPPRDAVSLSNAIKTYFNSVLFRALDDKRLKIIDFAQTRNSWSIVGDMTCDVYSQLCQLDIRRDRCRAKDISAT